MQTFTYKVQASDGSLEEGEMQGESKYTIASKWKQEGKTVISIEEKTKEGILHSLGNISFLSRVKLQEKILFTRNLGAMIDAGLPLARALGVLERQSTNPLLKQIISQVSADIKEGKQLSDSMSAYKKIFSPLVIAMIRVGEESGNLSQSLETVATQLDKSYALRKKIKGAMMYPAIIMIIMCIIGVLMLMFVVPTLTATFIDLDVELPASTKVIIGISNALQTYPLLILIGLIATIGLLYSFSKTKSGKRTFDFVSLHIPIISTIVKEYNTAQTMRTLSSLLSAGVGVVESIAITQNVLQNSYYVAVLETSAADVQKGIPLSDSFVHNQNIYPILASELILVGEETGQLTNMLERSAIFYENEVNQKTKDLSTIIEPFLMVFIGGAVGFFAVSMITPMYSLTSGI
jgi:type IV pilus assembly protein PilC